MNDQQIRLFREIRILYRGHCVLARQFFRHIPRRHRVLRSGSAGRGALRRQPDPGAEEPHASGGRAQGPDHPGARGRQGRNRRLWRHLHRQPRPSRIAVVAVGYADGFLRSAGASKGKPAAEVIVAGRRCPIAGRVSMDLFAVDVTDSARGHRASRRSCHADRRWHEHR